MAFSCMSTRSARAIAIAPPEPPSPMMQETIGTRRRAWSVHQRDHREVVPLGQLHRAHGLAVPLRERHAGVAQLALLQVPALLMTDQRDGPSRELPDSGDDGLVVGAASVPMQLHPI